MDPMASAGKAIKALEVSVKALGTRLTALEATLKQKDEKPAYDKEIKLALRAAADASAMAKEAVMKAELDGRMKVLVTTIAEAKTLAIQALQLSGRR